MHLIFPLIALLYLYLVIRMAICILAAFCKPFADLSKRQFGYLLTAALLFILVGPVLGFIRYDQYPPEIPYASAFKWILITLTAIGMAGFWASFLYKKSLSGSWSLAAVVAMWVGAGICLLNGLHFIPMAAMGVMFPVLGFELVSPYMALLLILRELYQLHAFRATIKATTPGGFWQKTPGEQLMYILPLAAVTVITVCMVFTLGGYPEDALIRVFTQSKVFSFPIEPCGTWLTVFAVLCWFGSRTGWHYLQSAGAGELQYFHTIWPNWNISRREQWDLICTCC